MKILIVNGPNLNLTGRRQPEIYGTTTMDAMLSDVRAQFPDHEILYFQSNHEGDIIDRLQDAEFGDNPVDAIVINAGAYTHTSLAIADALAALSLPIVEVHLSNIYEREPIRRTSLLSPFCSKVIVGQGINGYSLAIRHLV